MRKPEHDRSGSPGRLQPALGDVRVAQCGNGGRPNPARRPWRSDAEQGQMAHFRWTMDQLISRFCHNNDVFIISPPANVSMCDTGGPRSRECRRGTSLRSLREGRRCLDGRDPRPASQRTCPCWLVGLGSGRVFLCAREYFCTTLVRDVSACDDVDLGELRSFEFRANTQLVTA